MPTGKSRVPKTLMIVGLICLTATMNAQTKGPLKYNSATRIFYQSYWPEKYSVRDQTIKQFFDTYQEAGDRMGAYVDGFRAGYAMAGLVMQDRLLEMGYTKGSWEYILTEWIIRGTSSNLSEVSRRFYYWQRKNPQVRVRDVMYGFFTSEVGTSNDEIRQWRFKDEREY